MGLGYDVQEMFVYSMVSTRDHPCAMSVNVIVSESLIRTTKPTTLTKENESNFCLGFPGWCPCSNYNDLDDFTIASTSGKLGQPKKTTTKSVKVSDKIALCLAWMKKSYRR